jgi:hypothetical protein
MDAIPGPCLWPVLSLYPRARTSEVVQVVASTRPTGLSLPLTLDSH